MSTLQIHILAGETAGTRLQLNQSAASFGRSPDNTLVLDSPVVSRQHGTLERDAMGQWTLTNLSPNGTRVGRKKITKKPGALSDGVVVSIGDTEVFRVHLTPSQDAPAPSQPAQTSPADAPLTPTHAPHAAASSEPMPGTGTKHRSKLWIGLGIWLVICIGVLIFLATLDKDPDNPGGGPRGPWNPSQALSDMPPGPDAGRTAIRRLLEKAVTFQQDDASLHTKHLRQARDSVNRGEYALYDAYNHYQQAIAYSADRSSPFAQPTDAIRYNNVLDEMARIIFDRYMQAYWLYKKGDYTKARDELDTMRRSYFPRFDGELADHIKRLRNAAHQRARR